MLYKLNSFYFFELGFMTFSAFSRLRSHFNTHKKNQAPSALLGVSLFGILLFLSACGSPSYVTGPNVHQKHAKRGYNKGYTIKGQDYQPQSHYGYAEEGIASYYGAGDGFHGKKTSTGEQFDKNGLTCAHKTLPLPSVVRVTNLKNGRSIKLRVVDRGPFVKGRIVDVSEKAAVLLGFKRDGITRVRVECLQNESMLLAQNYNPNNANPHHVMGVGGVTSAVTGLLPQTKPLYASNNRSVAKRTAPQKRQENRTSDKGSTTIMSAVANGSYIQVGTYGDRGNARAQALKLTKQLGRPCKAYEFQSQGRKMYRVVMGPIVNQKDSSFVLAQLKRTGIDDAFMIAK